MLPPLWSRNRPAPIPVPGDMTMWLDAINRPPVVGATGLVPADGAQWNEWFGRQTRNNWIHINGFYYLQPQGPEAPTYKATGLNGRPCVHGEGAARGSNFYGGPPAASWTDVIVPPWDGGNGGATRLAMNAALGIAGTGWSVYMVFSVLSIRTLSVTATTAYKGDVLFGEDNGVFAITTSQDGGGTLWVYQEGNGQATAINRPIALNTAYTMSYRGGTVAGSGLASLRLNSNAETTLATGVPRNFVDGNMHLLFGDYQATPAAASGNANVGELITYDRRLSDAEDLAVRGYLSAKWGTP